MLVKASCLISMYGRDNRWPWPDASISLGSVMVARFAAGDTPALAAK